MGMVFINYRRDETAGEARALHNDLAESLGADSVFMDVDNIALGRDFREVLKERLGVCDVMLVLIGKEWSEVRDATGARRLDNPDDFVRLEIATALERNVAVTPVLLQGARMPSANVLPRDLENLAYRNAFEVSHTRWESDVRELVRRLGLAPVSPPIQTTRPPQRVDGPAPVRKMLPLAICAAVVIAAAAAWMAGRGGGSAPLPASTPAPAAVPAAAPVLVPVPVPVPSAVDTVPDPNLGRADIEKLLDQLNDPLAATRSLAASRLSRNFSRSALAVGLGVNQLSATNFQALGKDARAEIINFLLSADDAAWTADRRAAAADAVRRIRQRIEAGKARLSPEVTALLDRLGARVGA